MDGWMDGYKDREIKRYIHRQTNIFIPIFGLKP